MGHTTIIVGFCIWLILFFAIVAMMWNGLKGPES